MSPIIVNEDQKKHERILRRLSADCSQRCRNGRLIEGLFPGESAHRKLRFRRRKPFTGSNQKYSAEKNRIIEVPADFEPGMHCIPE